MKLPIDPKWVLIALAVVVALVVAFFFWSRSDKQKKVKESNAAIDQANREIDPNQVSVTAEQAEALADKLWNAMLGPGTDYDAIKTAIRTCKSRSDVITVAATYRQKYGDSWFSNGTLWSDLVRWLPTTTTTITKATRLNLPSVQVVRRSMRFLKTRM